MRMIYDNLADAATLTASPALADTLPAENLQSPERETVARTTGLASQTIDVTLDQARAMSACVLYRGNFTGAATWRVRVYDTPAMGTLLYDSGSQYLAAPKPFGDLEWGVDPLGVTLFTGWGYTFSTLWFPTVIGQFVRIELADAANPDGYMEASRLFIGRYLEPSNMPIAGAHLQWCESTRQERSEGGTLHSEPAAPYRALVVSGIFMGEKDRTSLSDMQRVAGLRKDVFVSMYPTEANARARDHAMQAKLVALDPMPVPLYGTVNCTLRFQEA